jgi:hypothetical protein
LTLIKFGINSVFAMWIMNSEFRPVNKSSQVVREDPTDIVQRKLRDCMQRYPEGV